jgi:hypothetical protein
VSFGSDSFHFENQENGPLRRFPQSGREQGLGWGENNGELVLRLNNDSVGIGPEAEFNLAVHEK